MKMTKILPPSSMPNQRMASGIQASGEIGRNSSTTGSSTRSSRCQRPMAKPSGTATIAASTQAESTRNTL